MNTLTEHIKRIVRRLTVWAWADFLWDVGRVEWKFGRWTSGATRDWEEWNAVRNGLIEVDRAWAVRELRKKEEVE